MPLFHSRRCAAALAAWLMAGSAAGAEIPPLPAPTAPLESTHPLVGRAFAADGPVTPQRAAEMAAAADTVLLGEKHDNPDHHRLQAWFVEAVLALGRRPAIAMEMLDDDQAESLAAYRKKEGIDAAGLGPAIGWQARGWPDWAMYAPIAAAALRADLPIVPADLTRANIRAVGRGGLDAIGPGLANQLESSERYGAAQASSLSEELRASHCGQMPESALPRMMDVQWARDANMARVLRATAPAVLIAGAGHVRADRGVPWHLKTTAPELKVLSVGFIEAEAGRIDPASYGEMQKFDIVWFTARVDNEDPCIKFRDSLQRRRQP